MGTIHEFLTREFLPQRHDLVEPDGRLLHLYKCEDQEFRRLVDLLRESGAPSGHDFDEYRTRWRAFREELRGGGQQHGFSTPETVDLDWIVRGFVLYASEFWLRFKNDEWRQRSFPDGLPFRKLTWLQFLSLVDWTDLYRGEEIAGYVELPGTPYRVAHANRGHADSDQNNAEDEGRRFDGRSMADTGHYPGLYFPMLKAWDWWKVAPVRLPTSIRYLDTFAHQGGAGDRLEVKCRVAYETPSKVVYRPVKPPNGYGMESLPIEREALPRDAVPSELNVTLLFGPRDGSGEE